MNHDQARQIIALLTEIRDRMPPLPAAPGETTRTLPKPAVLFGYVLGSGEYPTEAQVRAARAWLDNAESLGSWKVAEWDAAQEIVDAASRR